MNISNMKPEQPDNLSSLEILRSLDNSTIEYIENNYIVPKKFLGKEIISQTSDAQLSFSENIQLGLMEPSDYDAHSHYLIARLYYCSNEYHMSMNHLETSLSLTYDVSSMLTIKSLILYLYNCTLSSNIEDAVNIIFNLLHDSIELLDSKDFLFCCSICLTEALHHNYNKYSEHEEFTSSLLIRTLEDL